MWKIYCCCSWFSTCKVAHLKKGSNCVKSCLNYCSVIRCCSCLFSFSRMVLRYECRSHWETAISERNVAHSPPCALTFLYLGSCEVVGIWPVWQAFERKGKGVFARDKREGRGIRLEGRDSMLKLRMTRGSHNPNLQVAITHARHVLSQHRLAFH